ncbi:MAG: AAA family ATPase [Oscillospiraceae bacterium]
MKMKLNRLKIENFKGVRSFEIFPNGGNLEITGRNKLGKTTIYDAFLWLLFGKNSAGETKFTVKPTNLPVETENSVEADFTVDGKLLTLKKVYASKYVKTTGEYKSSELECYINGVPKKICEYEAEISNIISEDKFKLLTNPKHFTENLEWKSRREILFSVLGNQTDAEIAAENASFSEIEADLAMHNSTDFLKMLNAQVKANSERINTLPMRINENINNLSGRSEDIKAVENEIETLKKESAEASEKVGTLKVWNPNTSSEYIETEKKLADLEHRNYEFHAEQDVKNREARYETEKKLADLKSKLAEHQKDLRIIVSNISSLKADRCRVTEDNKRLNSLEWHGDTVCPTCGQALPAEKIEKAKADFKAEIAAGFDRNIEKMSIIGKQLDDYESKQCSLEKNISSIESEIAELESKRPIVCDVFDLPEYEELSLALKSELVNLAEKPNPNTEEIIELQKNLEYLSKRIDEKTIVLNALKLDERTNARIAELKTEQQKLRGDQARLQMKLDLLNDFIRYKVAKITETVNGMFKIAKFKLFEPNKTNDGLTECCDAIAFGADRYNDINTAGKILVGIDIISTLSEHYGLAVPLFIDNIDGLDSSSYSGMLETIADKMQLITLRVSDEDKLTVKDF